MHKTELTILNFKHEINKSKGSEINKVILKVSCNVCVIQDANIENDKEEYNLLIKPIISGFAYFLYGARFIGNNAHRILFFWHTIAKIFLTFSSNFLMNLNLSNMKNCYKLFRA
jgi:hypothetical protein